MTAQEGEDVTFQVEVGGGKPPYTYQWQVWDPKHEKWMDLPGFYLYFHLHQIYTLLV